MKSWYSIYCTRHYTHYRVLTTILPASKDVEAVTYQQQDGVDKNKIEAQNGESRTSRVTFNRSSRLHTTSVAISVVRPATTHTGDTRTVIRRGRRRRRRPAVSILRANSISSRDAESALAPSKGAGHGSLSNCPRSPSISNIIWATAS